MNNEITLKYIGYARKSSEDNRERQAASLPDQIFILEGMKAKYNLQLLEILQESQSAHKPGRIIFNTMLKRIESGEINAILVWHPNRLARNMSEGGRIIDLIDDGKLVEIRTPSRTYQNSPEDKFMLSLEFSLSKKDSDDKSIVVKRGLEKKLRDGWRPGEAPVGYLNDKFTESGQRKIFVDKERLPFVSKIFELFHSGISVKEIYQTAKDDWHFRTRQRKRIGGKPLSIGMIYMILNNPFYIGKYEYPIGSGNWYEGKHEKAVSEDLFNEIQIKLGHRSQYKLKHHDYAYTSLVRCGYCNSGIVAEQKWQCICANCKVKFSITKENKDRCSSCQTLIGNMAKPNILHYIYYRCKHKKQTNPRCSQLGVEVQKLEKQIDDKLGEIEISPLFMDWAIRQIQKMNESEKNFREDTISGIKRAHDECRVRLDNLLQLKISPENRDSSLLSDERYRMENTKLEKELKDIEKQLTNIDNRMLQANQDTVRGFNFATRARMRFATGDMKTKRDIFMGLGVHLKLFDKMMLFDSPKYLLTLKNMKKEVPSIGQLVAPTMESVPITEMEALWASNSIVLRSRESHPA